jgi:hypothetical protein
MHRLHEAADLLIAAFLTPKTEVTGGRGGDSSLIPCTADVWSKASGHQMFGQDSVPPCTSPALPAPFTGLSSFPTS